MSGARLAAATGVKQYRRWARAERRADMRGKKGSPSKLIFVALLIVVIGIAWYLTAPSQPGQEGQAGRKPVLDPAQFVGEVKAAYQVAIDIPFVLEKMKCYCGCDNPMHKPYHRSLYECFTDTHGANCQVCVAMALRASKLYSQGYSVEDIRRMLDEEFGQ